MEKLINREVVPVWLLEMHRKGKHLRRYKKIDLNLVEFDREHELIKHANRWLDDKDNFTFHHIRNLVKSLKKDKYIKYPLVGIDNGEKIQMHPGCSRIMASDIVGVDRAPLDLICDTTFSHKLVDDETYEIVSTMEEFYEAYKEVTCNFWLQTCYEDTDLPFYESKKWKGEFWYQINYEDIWHFRYEDIALFNKMFHKTKKENPLDFYLL